MATIISTKTSGVGGLEVTGDATGILQLASNNGTTAVTVDASQNVGIGTSTTNPAGFGKGVNLDGTSNVGYQVSVGGTFTGYFGAYTSETRIGSISTYPMTFYTNSTERMRIDSSGSIMAGTTTARGRLHLVEMSMGSPVSSNGWTTKAAITLSGNYGGSLTLIDGSGGYNIRCDDFGNDLYIQGGATSGGVAGGVYLNNYGTSWSSASDENVKDIIEPITNAVDKVSTLRAVIGKYKYEEEGIRHPFLIAQDVQAVLPEAVSIMNKGEETECLGLSYTDTIPLLVASIKELKAIIDTQAERIAVLENKQ